MSDTLGIALVGCGTVGGGVAHVLLAHAQRVAQRAGRPLVLRRVVVRDLAKPRDPLIARDIISTDLSAAINDPNVHVVVELIGGTGVAKKVRPAGPPPARPAAPGTRPLLADSARGVPKARRRAHATVCSEPPGPAGWRGS